MINPIPPGLSSAELRIIANELVDYSNKIRELLRESQKQTMQLVEIVHERDNDIADLLKIAEESQSLMVQAIEKAKAPLTGCLN